MVENKCSGVGNSKLKTIPEHLIYIIYLSLLNYLDQHIWREINHMAGIQDLINSFKRAFHSCDNDSMHRIHSEFLEQIQVKAKIKRSLDFPEYIRYKSELEYFNLIWDYLEAEDWYLVTQSNDIKVQSRGSGNEFFTKCEVIVHQDLFKTLAVLTQIDLVTSWVSVVTKIDILSEPTITRKLTKFHYWFPWPLSNRQCLIEFNAFPIISQKGCMIMMRTPESENYMGKKTPPFEPGEVKMWVRIGCLYAQIVDENTTKVTFMVSADGNIVRVI